MKNPCFTCKLKNSDKNNPTCLDCRDRVGYVDYLEYSCGLSVISLREEGVRPTAKLLHRSFPGVTAEQLGMPECKTDRCLKVVHAGGFCHHCYVRNWRVVNPRKYKQLRINQGELKKKRKQGTLQLDFRYDLSYSRKHGTGKDCLAVLKDLILIAEEEMRPITSQAVFFIREGVRRWKEEKGFVEDTLLERQKGVLRLVSEQGQ